MVTEKMQRFVFSLFLLIGLPQVVEAEALVIPPHTEVLGFHLGMSDCSAAAIELSRSHREMSQTLSSEVPSSYYLINVSGNGFDLPGLEGVSLVCSRANGQLVHGVMLAFNASATNDVLVALNSKYKRTDNSTGLVLFESPNGLISVEVFSGGRMRAFYADTALVDDLISMSKGISSKL